MKCPYCEAEMEQGMIQSPQEIAWLKGDKRKIFARAMLYEDSIILSELSMMKGSAVEAYLCRECKKVVIDYSDAKSDLNQR